MIACENLFVNFNDFENEIPENVETEDLETVKTFNSISHDDDILQMYLKQEMRRIMK